MQVDKIEKLKNKIYLGKLSIVNYDFYYGMLLNGLDIIISKEVQKAEIKNRCIYFNEAYLEKIDIPRLALCLVKILEKHLDELGLFDKSRIEKIKGGGTFANNVFESDSDGGKVIKEKLYWQEKIGQTVRALKAQEKYSKVPGKAWIYIENDFSNKINWYEQLIDFIMYDITDYCFLPPDYRYEGTDFFLPSFDDKTEKVENILFMFDTSESMKKNIIKRVFAEVKNAISQFRGNMKGYVGCFDTIVYDVKEFEDINSLNSFKMKGGGGTSFVDIFKFANTIMSDKELKAIVILTDGYGEFPNVEATSGIPVLWIIVNSQVKPPFGRVGYFSYDDIEDSE